MKWKQIFIMGGLALVLAGCTQGGSPDQSLDSVSKTRVVETTQKETIGRASAPSLSDFINPEGTTLQERMIPPAGYTRVEASEGSFALFLRRYPMEPDGTPVFYFDKREKGGSGHAAVFSMEVGEEDLQQCADSIMRIYAEYLYQSGKEDRIRFHFVDGFVCDFAKWRQGYRVRFLGDTPQWQQTAQPDGGEESFRKYLRIVFAYSSTLSMEREAEPLELSQLQAGDIFIKGGSPGHVVLVTDVCENEKGEKAFLLSQGFMPAQSFHVIKNPAHPEDPWYYEKEITYPFRTQNYTFPQGSFMRPVYLKEDG